MNLFTLVHETAHQLSFNTGMLNRQADLPVCVSEGLATYVELWRPGVKNAIGGVNRPRMEDLRKSDDWIPIGDLLADDTAFGEKTEHLAYAESWLLVHYLLRSRSRQPRFRQFVAEVQTTTSRPSAFTSPKRCSGRWQNWITSSKTKREFISVASLNRAPG